MKCAAIPRQVKMALPIGVHRDDTQRPKIVIDACCTRRDEFNIIERCQVKAAAVIQAPYLDLMDRGMGRRVLRGTAVRHRAVCWTAWYPVIRYRRRDRCWRCPPNFPAEGAQQDQHDYQDRCP